MTPRCQKQAALMALVAARREKSMTAGESHDVHDVGTSHVDGGPQLLLRLSTAKRHDAPYHFLGKDLCSRSFLCCTGLSNNTLNSAVRFVKQGLTKYRQRQRNRHAVTQREMCQAIWMVIQDLHPSSPFAAIKDVQPDEWYIPFHHKVCLWRLVLQLHADRAADLSKPCLFSKPPRYGEFRRCVNMPEFDKVVFHRMVDIGRCPRCEYMEWKCASVPTELRSVWQEALANHHKLQIAQKRCYAADRAKASTQFPDVQLYMVFQYKKLPMMSMISMISMLVGR